MNKKYVIRPGLAQGPDGGMHTIDADTLMNLYKVKESDCEVLLIGDRYFDNKVGHYISQGCIFLFPRSDDNYSWIHQK